LVEDSSVDAAPAHMIAPDEALLLVGERTSPRPIQRVRLEAACGLQLAQDVRTEHDFPSFARAMMDGYAVRVSDAGQTVRVVGEVPAGASSAEVVSEGVCLEIMTGAVCPEGTEAVVPKEVAHREGDLVTLPKNLELGRHIAPPGSECRAGSVVLKRGDTMTPLAVAVVASLGRQEVEVFPRPTAAVITTGAELVSVDSELAPGQIYDSNGPMLVALLDEFRIEDRTYRHVVDQREAILEALEEAAEKDIILLSGGVSAGNYDLVPDCLAEYGATVVFHKVRQKPGKPLLFATKGEQLLFGLPGNPLACHQCFHRYAAAAIRGIQGKTAEPLQSVGVLAGEVVPKSGRTHFVPALAAQEESHWVLSPLPSVSSADIFSTSQANCYIEVPPGKQPFVAGKSLRFTWIGGAPWAN